MANREDDAETVVMRLMIDVDGLRGDLDKLVIRLEALMRERQEIIETLSRFYQSTLSISSVQPVLDLAVRLRPGLGPKVLMPTQEDRHL